MYLVIDLCEQDYFDFLSERGFVLSDMALKQQMTQLAEGVEYLHSMGIIHRDLKLENCMVVKKDTHTPLIKIADFGLGKILEKGKMAQESVGTLTYASPEILSGEKYTDKVDIWSLGVIYYIMLTAQMPFSAHDSNLLRKDVAKGNFKLPDSLIGTKKEALIKRMMCINKDKRADINEVKELI